VGVVDQSGTLLVKNSRPTKPERSFEAIVQDIAETALLSLEESGVKIDDIAGTGFGVPSTIDPKTKKMIFANNLSWLDVDLIAEFGKHFPGPVYIDNDADCAALGEAASEPQGCKNVLMVTFGTGFGGALLIDGKIFRGCDGYGIEPGHIVLVYGGRECTCGILGCVEAYVSIPALVEMTREKMTVNPGSLMWENCLDHLGKRDAALAGGRTAFTAAKKDDKAAQAVLDEFINMAGHAVGSLITVYRPEKVIIGGGLCNEGDFFITPLYEAAKQRYFGSGLMPMPPFVKARLGNDAGIIGAAMLVIL
jgi:glucokinase